MLVNLKESVFDYVTKSRADAKAAWSYTVKSDLIYYSRYYKFVLVQKGDRSDGATCAPDVDSFCWLFHDKLCKTGLFEDGTKCNNLQASTILYDILAREGRWFRKYTWFLATYLFGGDKARDNGMF